VRTEHRDCDARGLRSAEDTIHWNLVAAPTEVTGTQGVKQSVELS